MREHLFLCGLSDEQCELYGQATRLSMRGRSKNVRLSVENLRDRLSQVEPDALTDLLDIAAYVFRADNGIPRESGKDGRAGAEWRRTFRMVVAVREPGRWSEPSIVNSMAELLNFLSDDTWYFEFVKNLHPLPLEEYLPGLRGYEPVVGNATSVVLFSAGIDSFSGAVHELLTSNRNVVLASHGTSPFIAKRQRELAEVLKRDFGGRVTHVRVDAGSTGLPEPREHSQRTRSFLFLVVAAVAARIEMSDRIRFYENGIMSANLAISEQVVGTHASRSTHPRSIRLFNSFLATAIDADVTVDNPFEFDTKIEVVQRLQASPYASFIKNTLSCSATRQITQMHPHCGECKQCIERRLATLGAGVADEDPDVAYKVELFTEPRQNGKNRAMALDSVRIAFEMSDISLPDFVKRFAGDMAWLLTGCPQSQKEAHVHKIHAMFQRHGKRVDEIFQEAVAQHRAAIVSQTLSPDCLLWLAIEPFKPDVVLGYSAAEIAAKQIISEELEGPVVVETTITPPPEIVLLTDRSFTRFRIEETIPVSGDATLALLRYLVQEHRKDRNEDRSPKKFRGFSAKQLANVLGSPSEESVRKLVKRLRDDFRQAFHILHRVDPGEHGLIDRIGSGYRLNPRVRIVVE